MPLEPVSSLATIVMLGAACARLMTEPRISNASHAADVTVTAVADKHAWREPETFFRTQRAWPTEIPVRGTFGSPTALADAIHAQLDRYARLQPGWDGEESLAPEPQALEAAHRFLDTLPFGVPYPRPMITPEGEPEFYWDAAGGYLDVRFAADGRISIFGKARDGREFYEEDLLASSFAALPPQQTLRAMLAREDRHLPA